MAVSYDLQIREISPRLAVAAIVRQRSNMHRHGAGVAIQADKAPVAILISEHGRVSGYRPDGTAISGETLHADHADFVAQLRERTAPV
ncbi:MAG: hypothetical protein AAFR33_09890 [Pseudomonadota bacterium]